MGFATVAFTALIVAGIGLRCFWLDAPGPRRRLVIIWLVLGVALVYFPFTLQRRFMLGLYIPAAIVAAWLVDAIRTAGRPWGHWLWGGLLALSIPTNIAILLAGFYGVQTHDPLLYLTVTNPAPWLGCARDGSDAIFWPRQRWACSSAQTGRRVLYGTRSRR